MRIDPESAPPVPYAPPEMASRIYRLAEAFAREENSPPEWNNPLDISDTFGFPNRGAMNADGVTGFDTLTGGWLAGYHKIWLALSGHSHAYSGDMTLLEWGCKWAGPEQGPIWAKNVATFLAVTPETKVSES